jgi:hypothetical protein
MEEWKFALDVISGIVVPIGIAIIPLVWPAPSLSHFLRRVFFPGLAAIFGFAVLAIGYGWASGVYSPPDPLASLTDNQKKWLAHFLDKSESPKESLEKFYLNETKRFVFVTSKRDLYEIERVRGSVNGPDPQKDTYSFPVSQMTDSGQHKMEVRFYDQNSKLAMNFNEDEKISIPGTEHGRSYRIILPVKKDFDFIQCGLYEHTVAFPGSLDTIAIPMNRYKGGYSNIQYTVLFDHKVEKAGLYDVEKFRDGVLGFFRDKEVRLLESKIIAQNIDPQLLPSTIKEGLSMFVSADDQLAKLINAVPWQVGYKFTIANSKTPLAFQYIIQDE